MDELDCAVVEQHQQKRVRANSGGFSESSQVRTNLISKLQELYYKTGKNQARVGSPQTTSEGHTYKADLKDRAEWAAAEKIFNNWVSDFNATPNLYKGIYMASIYKSAPPRANYFTGLCRKERV